MTIKAQERGVVSSAVEKERGWGARSFARQNHLLATALVAALLTFAVSKTAAAQSTTGSGFVAGGSADLPWIYRTGTSIYSSDTQTAHYVYGSLFAFTNLDAGANVSVSVFGDNDGILQKCTLWLQDLVSGQTYQSSNQTSVSGRFVYTVSLVTQFNSGYSATMSCLLPKCGALTCSYLDGVSVNR